MKVLYFVYHAQTVAIKGHKFNTVILGSLGMTHYCGKTVNMYGRFWKVM